MFPSCPTSIAHNQNVHLNIPTRSAPRTRPPTPALHAYRHRLRAFRRTFDVGMDLWRSHDVDSPHSGLFVAPAHLCDIRRFVHF
jgi:hypothetical protein